MLATWRSCWRLFEPSEKRDGACPLGAANVNDQWDDVFALAR